VAPLLFVIKNLKSVFRGKLFWFHLIVFFSASLLTSVYTVIMYDEVFKSRVFTQSWSHRHFSPVLPCTWRLQSQC